MSAYQTNTGQNPFFDVSSPKYDSDKAFIGVLLNELYNKFGVCMEFYITSYDKTYDTVFGEDNDRRYERKFSVNGYFNLPREDKMWTKFGIEQTDEIIVWLSKRHFTGSSIDGKTGKPYEQPQIGDIIKSDYSNFFYEITEVAEDTGQYFQSNQFIWELHIRPMKDELITPSKALKDDGITDVTGMDDILGIKNPVDIEKEEIVYKPEKGEKPNEDPFGNW